MAQDTTVQPGNADWELRLDKEYFVRKSAYQGEIIKTDAKYIRQLEIIAVAELGVILLLGLLLLRKRSAKK